MAAPSITREDALKMRANLERNGRPVPDELKAATDEPAEPVKPPAAPATAPAVAAPKNPPARAARASATPAGGSTRPKPAPASAAPSSSGAAGKPGRAGARGGRGSSGSAGKSPWWGRRGSTSKRSSAGRSARSILKSPGTLGGGDGGGLLLAVFLYPLVLAMIQQGAKGPGIWLRAKFLNVAPLPDSTKPGTGASPGNIAPGGTIEHNPRKAFLPPAAPAPHVGGAAVPRAL